MEIDPPDSSCPSDLRTMTSALIRELQGWLRLAGVQRQGGRSLTGARELFWLAQDTGVEVQDVRATSRLFQRLPLLMADGDIWRRLAHHLDPLPRATAVHEFLQGTARIAPTWLAKSPRATSGKFELFYRLTRPECGWPDRGDVLDGGKVIEIKGRDGRLAHPTVTGMTHHTRSARAFGARGFVPNVSRVSAMKGASSFEVLKPYVQPHYTAQFHRRPADAASAVAEYLEDLGAVPEGQGLAAAAYALGGAEPVGERLRRLWLEAIYDEHAASRQLDRLIVFGDGADVKIIDERDQLDKLEISGVGLRTGTPDRLSVRVN